MRKIKIHVSLLEDGKSVCPEDSTCCQLMDQSFGCCPFQDGNCCSDHVSLVEQREEREERIIILDPLLSLGLFL